ncbi:NAD-dependent epimerase/dehydratase family protein [Paraflavitalea soli]|uniref:NAD-dependent epimerase/dehydratase family protein n=1 Tax=Paraflavitalea soli TaxID=2315862 RepID=A0A3B7MT97_9BACT|nr:NAD-dependent epimerase/dehydratase family protein [Paraflavitalea soli]AXY77097.1 NAD-dependent epimerase/dehydratase family protein [Paraflavitalea soli]
MKVLILGSEGFIGNHLVKHFLQNKWDVTGCDLIEASPAGYQYQKISLLSADLEQLFAGLKYDACINAAGSGNVPYSLTHPLSDFEANVSSVIHVLEVIRKFNPECRYIHISSAAVYGNPQQLPIEETAALMPLSPYGWHKQMSEQLCLEYYQQFGVRTAVTRPFSVYGPGLRKQLFWDVYQKILKAGNTLELWGTGKESRDFIFVEDLVQALWLILEKGNMQGESYNVATGVETTIEEAVGLFIRALQQKTSLAFNQKGRPGDPLYWRADMSRLTSLGFKPAYSLEKGLQLTADWITVHGQ